MKTFKLLLAALCGGILCAAVRVWQLQTGFEADTGLAIPGKALPLALLLTVVAAVLLPLTRGIPTRQGKRTPHLTDWFSFGGTFSIFCLVCGCFLLMLFGGMTAAPLDGKLFLLLGGFAVFAAVCTLALVVSCRKKAAQPKVMLLLAPAAFLVVELIVIYRRTGRDPVLAAFYVEILAMLLLTVSFSQLTSIAYGCGAPRRYAYCTALSVVLCLCALVDRATPSDAALFSAFALLQLGFLSALTWTVKSRVQSAEASVEPAEEVVDAAVTAPQPEDATNENE